MQLISGGASSASTVHNTGRHNLPSKSTRRSTHQEVLLLFVRVKPWLCSTVAQFKCSRGDCSLMFDTEENLTVAFTSKRTFVWPIVLLIHSRHLSQLETAGRSLAPPHSPLKWRRLGTWPYPQPGPPTYGAGDWYADANCPPAPDRQGPYPQNWYGYPAAAGNIVLLKPIEFIR